MIIHKLIQAFICRQSCRRLPFPRWRLHWKKPGFKRASGAKTRRHLFCTGSRPVYARHRHSSQRYFGGWSIIEPVSGKVVICALNGEPTVKRLEHGNNKWKLKANHILQRYTTDWRELVWVKW